MERVTQLIVFADDWGRHPSSGQHLVQRLLDRYPTLWVNTIGMRRPQLSRDDLAKLKGRLREWVAPIRFGRGRRGTRAHLTVIAPRMWPGFGHAWQRRLNAHLISRAVQRALPRRATHTERRAVVTTLPITADLIGRVDADAWIYYCVDDHSAWPGLNGQLMREMESQLIARVGHLVAASEALRERLAAMGYASTLLTHGVDVAHWRRPNANGARVASSPALPNWWRDLQRPIFLFWGLIDRRLDVAWIRALQDSHAGPRGALVLVGPTQAHDRAIDSVEGVILPGAVPYELLPLLATQADVLVMPYADLPVTRAMQPLKLKEYLATGKPVVMRSLPSTRAWAAAADVVETAEDFVGAVRRRVTEGVPPHHLAARRELVHESWECKARELEAVLAASVAEVPPMRPAAETRRHLG
jgi:glycosyltransferase involved in cell wall biosynthesis